MEKKFKKIKQFIIDHDELFFIIVFSIIVFGINIYNRNSLCDEIWNFQNIFKMYEGYQIYADANVITTPLFHFIGFIIFKIFGANFFVFKMYGIIIDLIMIFVVYKIFKKLKTSKKIALLSTIIFYIVESSLFSSTTNYNNLGILFLIIGIWHILNREKYSDNKFLIMQAVIIFLVILTKQTIGIPYMIGFFIYEVLFEKKGNRIKNLLKIAYIELIFIMITIILFNRIGILDGFISYAILGIKEFAQRNVTIGFSIITYITMAMISALGIFFYNKMIDKHEEEKKNMKILACFSFPLLMMAYPIFNIFHIYFSLSLMFILLIYMAFTIFKDIVENIKFLRKAIVILILILNTISIIRVYLYFNEIKNEENSYTDMRYGILLMEGYPTKEKQEKIIEYIKNNDKDVIVFAIDAALYMMPLNKSNGYMDEPLIGNFGKDGEDGVIEKLSNMKNTIILMNEYKMIWQESDKARQYIRDNYEYIGEMEEFSIYETKK